MADEQQAHWAPELVTIGLAILRLLADERDARVADQPGTRRTEVLLAEAGMTAPQIAALMDKSPGAVRMAVSRSKSGRKEDGK